jgi:hypothetical protein
MNIFSWLNIFKKKDIQTPPTGPSCGLVSRLWINEYDFIDRKCPPCHQDCKQGRECPARK